MQSNSMTPTYTDFSGFSEMRAQAQMDPNASLKQVARQFEGIFIGMMLKSMRDASMGDPIFDSNQSEVYRDMFDKQISLDMANGKGIGFADALVRQLGGTNAMNDPHQKDKSESEINSENDKQQVSGIRSGKMLPASASRMNTVSHLSVRELSNGELPALQALNEPTQFSSPQDFTNSMLPYAEEAAKKLGVSPLVLVAQAALETGWGKSITRHRDGSSSFNVFNIKADERWQGDRVVKSTLEYSNGLAKYEKANFRAYDSFADSFDDYVNFLRSNSRYGSALLNQGDDKLFIQDLHKAGYATDPDYADKILDIMQRDSLQAHADSSSGQLNV